MTLTSCDPRAFLRLGRYDGQEKACALWWPGSGIRLRLACRTLEIEAESFASDHAPWLGVLADGAPIARFPLAPGRRRYAALAGMDAAILHEITLLRDTQPAGDEPEPVLLHGLFTDGAPQKAEARGRTLEFIGDSLTVGEGCAGPESAEEWRMAWMSHMGAFPTLVSEGMGAEKRVIAVSGWGVWRGWDGDDTHCLGLIYDRLCAQIPAGNRPYDFAERPADAVVINLGTNDASAIRQAANPTDAAEAFTGRAEALLAQVRARQPGALILWAYGLCGSEMAAYIRRAVDARRRAGDARTAFLSLSDCGGSLGSLQHPSRAAHRRAAEEICDFLEKNL